MINYTDLIGVPFKNRGRDVSTGLDCYGLVMEIFKRYGYNIPEYNEDFHNTEKVCALIREKTAIRSNWERVDKNNLPIPSLLTISYGVHKGIVNHTGVYIGDGKFIHIRSTTGVCVDRVNSPAWARAIGECYKYVGENSNSKKSL